MKSTMAENRVHPTTAPEQPSSTVVATSADGSSDRLLPKSSPRPESPGKNPATSPPLPPPAYVIQIPKEQIFSYPPPGNARKYDHLSRRKTRRSGCRVCLCATIGLLLFLIVSAAIAAGVLYLVLRPKAPNYSVLDMSIRGMNLTSPLPISPVFVVSIRAENPNKKIGIEYRSGSEVEVFYGDVSLANGGLPAFFQPSRNVTVFQTTLKGSNVVLATDVRSAMRTAQNQSKVPLTCNIKAPVKIKVGSVKTWKITVKVKCDLTVEALDEKASIVSKDCDYSAKLW